MAVESLDQAALARSLIERAAALRVPSLFGRREAVYRHHRRGISAVMVNTDALSEASLEALLRFRLASYAAADAVDLAAIMESGLRHEPLDSVPRDDVHVVAGTDEGEILSCLSLRRSAPAWPGQPMRSHDRAPFPVEANHGIGVFDRLSVLPELSVAKVREVERFAKGGRMEELGARGPLEVLIGLIRGTLGALRDDTDALIGEVEERGVRRKLDYLGIPTVLVHGTVVHELPSFYKQCGRPFRPFALSVPDVGVQSLPRVAAVERALALPWPNAVRELIALKRTTAPPRSVLEPHA